MATTKDTQENDELKSLAELLASPDDLFILWRIFEGHGADSALQQESAPNPKMRGGGISHLLAGGFVVREDRALALTDLGRKALSHFIDSLNVARPAHVRLPDAKPTITITQVRSAAGQAKRQQQSLRGLGLRRINHTVERSNTPEIRGLIASIPHLVRVEDDD